MKQRPRIYYTETDKALMWDRWQLSHHLRWADQAVQVLYSPWSRKKTVPGAGVKRASFAFQVMLGNQTLGGLIADAARKRVINDPCLEYRRSVWVNRSTM